MSNAGDDTEGQRIKNLGWRQGSILPAELASRLYEARKLPDVAPSRNLLIVVSHDCDVTSSNLANEPFVELLFAKLAPEIAAADGALAHGRNPRRLQFEVRVDGEVRLAEAKGHDRFLTDRRELLACRPDHQQTLDRETVREIATWLAKRYVRAAFPDSFEQRLDPTKKAVRSALRTNGWDIQEIWVAANSWDELPRETPYHIWIVATMADANFCDEARRGKAQRAMDAMEERLQDCPGIVIEEVILKSEAEVTIHDRRSMRRFDFDYLSSDER